MQCISKAKRILKIPSWLMGISSIVWTSAILALQFCQMSITPLWKDLKFLKNILPMHKTGRIFKMGFALSKWPHLHRAYLPIIQEYIKNLALFNHFAKLYRLCFTSFCTALTVRQDLIRWWNTVVWSALQDTTQGQNDNVKVEIMT